MANTNNTPATRAPRRTSLEMVLAACSEFTKLVAYHGGVVAKKPMAVEELPQYREMETQLRAVSELALGVVEECSANVASLAEKEKLLKRAIEAEQAAETAKARIAELEEKLRVAGQGEAQPAKGSKAKAGAAA